MARHYSYRNDCCTTTVDDVDSDDDYHNTSRTNVARTITGNATTSEAIAKRLRDKIRLQAEALLSRCDESTSRRRSEHTVITNCCTDDDDDDITEPTMADTTTTTTTATAADRIAVVTPPSSNSLHTSYFNDNVTCIDNPTGTFGDDSGCTTRSNSPSAVSSISNSCCTLSSSLTMTTTTTNDLTKRIQKLALERRRQQEGEVLLFPNTGSNDSGGGGGGNNNQRLQLIQSDTSSPLSSSKTFDELQLPMHLLQALYQMGFNRPSSIQEMTLPRILQGRNVIGQAQSGSGKTVAFTIGMLYRIDTTCNTTQALCVTPTRELAIQIVDQAIVPMSRNIQHPTIRVQLAIAQCAKPLSAASASSSSQNTVPHIVVGTPGKIVDWMKRRIIVPHNIKVFVLDEADTMVDVSGNSGHRANSLLIQQKLPYECQCLFFSATFSPSVLQFASKIMRNNNAVDKILIADGRPEHLVVDIIKQLYVDTRNYQGGGGKLEFLADIYSLLTIGQSIVFVGRKDDADEIYDTLQQAGYTCSLLHGAVEPTARDTVMESFRNGESNVLITTNVLARGVDVDNVCLVVNYDLPLTKNNEPDYETYLHRIGRTGRFGRKGTAINLIDNDASMNVLQSIERHFRKSPKNDDAASNSIDGTSIPMMIQEAMADPESLADLIEI